MILGSVSCLSHIQHICKAAGSPLGQVQPWCGPHSAERNLQPCRSRVSASQDDQCLRDDAPLRASPIAEQDGAEEQVQQRSQRNGGVHGAGIIVPESRGPPLAQSVCRRSPLGLPLPGLPAVRRPPDPALRRGSSPSSSVLSRREGGPGFAAHILTCLLLSQLPAYGFQVGL